MKHYSSMASGTWYEKDMSDLVLAVNSYQEISIYMYRLV